MTLRSKLTLMFFGALQVTFLTAVGTFWAVQSWQLLTDDLTLIHEQNVRLEHVLEGGTAAQRAAFLRASISTAARSARWRATRSFVQSSRSSPSAVRAGAPWSLMVLTAQRGANSAPRCACGYAREVRGRPVVASG